MGSGVVSGSQLVREFRSPTQPTLRSVPSLNWRKIVIAAGAGVCVLAFGAIVVRANDGSVWDVHKQYGGQQRQYARTTPLPQIFVPQGVLVKTSLSYAPVMAPLAPSGHFITLPSTSRRGSGKAAKISPVKANADSIAINSSTSYCVRTCDGFFFPLGNPNAADLAAHDAACARQCPAAETAVFVAPSGSRGIEDAINRKGERYENTRTAFNHRTQFDKACSCASPGAPRNYSVMTDFTLRKGDYVMSTEGLKVYRGEEGETIRARAFARADFSTLSPAERKAMEATEAASVRGLAVSPTLRARISAQVDAARPRVANANSQHRVALVGHKAQGPDGRDMRYVGPDMTIDRAR
jgi:hypothetical protein